MNDIIEYSKIILPIIAIGISIFSIVLSKKNFKRQIRIAKLEELLENFFYVCTHYWHFRILLENLKDILNEDGSISKERVKSMTNSYKKDVEILREKEIFEKVAIKSNRVGILANSYLPNGTLKLKIISTCKLINEMIDSLDSENLIPINSFSEKLPSRSAFARIIEEIEKSKLWTNKIVTEVTMFARFYPAEDYHQEYYKINGHEPYCSYVISPKMAKFRKEFKDRLKE